MNKQFVKISANNFLVMMRFAFFERFIMFIWGILIISIFIYRKWETLKSPSRKQQKSNKNDCSALRCQFHNRQLNPRWVLLFIRQLFEFWSAYSLFIYFQRRNEYQLPANEVFAEIITNKHSSFASSGDTNNFIAEQRKRGIYSQLTDTPKIYTMTIGLYSFWNFYFELGQCKMLIH